MAAINGTVCLLYSEGVVIAYQKGLSISVETDLPDATNKQSAGWAEHINGMRNAKIDFSALFSASALPVMSANDLMNYILTRETLLVSILGLSVPIVAQADMNSLSFDAPLEGTMGLSGSLKVKGPLYLLKSPSNNLITDPDGTSNSYDTLSLSGTTILSAIDTTAAFCRSDTFAIDSGTSVKVITFLTLNSGEAPSVVLDEAGVGDRSNSVAVVAGLNVVTLTATASATVELKIVNTAATNFSTSPIYVFVPQ